MVLTGDDLAKHAKLLPRKVIRELGHMLHQPWYASGNWETVAENLGYGYEEIKHFATMASVKQDVTPGELMLHDWVQQTYGRTLFVLYNALNKADRTDCVQYLEKEIYNSVICTELMLCIKYEDGRSASHMCVTTSAESCLLDCLHDLLEQPVQAKYHLLDGGVSWTETLAKHFKGRQLMLLRRQDGCNMEQDPTIDSSCTDPDLSTHNHLSSSTQNHLLSSTQNYMSSSTQNRLSSSTHNHLSSSTQNPQAGTPFTSLTSTKLKQISGSQIQTISQTHFQSMPVSRLHTVSSTQQCSVSGTSMQSVTAIKPYIITKSNNLNYRVQERGNVEQADDNRHPDFHTALKSMATESPSNVKVSMADNSNIEIPDQNDLNLTSVYKTQTSSSLLNVMDTSSNICKNENKKCKDIFLPLNCEMRRYCVRGSSSSSIEDNRVFDTIEYKRNIVSADLREDLTEHEDDYKDPSEYLKPAERNSVFGAEVIGMKESHNLLQGPKHPTESSDYSEYKDCNAPESEASSRHGNQIVFEESGTDLESAEYQYSGWGVQGNDPYICQEETVEYSDEHTHIGEDFPASSILSGINRCCSLTSEPGDGTLDERLHSEGFSVSCCMSVDGSPSSESFTLPYLDTIDHDTCSDKQTNSTSSAKKIKKSDRTRLYLDFNSYAQESAIKNADDRDLSGSEIDDVSHGGKSGIRMARCISENPDQTFRKPVYESLQRGISCPSEVVCNEYTHLPDTPVIAEVFSPVLNKPRMADCEEFDEGCWQTLSSTNSINTPPVKRQTVTLPFCIQNQNPKRSRQSLPAEKNVRFYNEAFQLSMEAESPSLPPRTNLPDIQRSSFTTEDFRQRRSNRPEQPQMDEDDVPKCKIVIAGKSRRPPLDNLLVNDKLFEYYREQLDGYQGWCPLETENTIQKTMQDTLSSDGYYMLWYMRERKSLVLSVSFHHSLINYRIHTKVMNKTLSFYISQGHDFQHLHELLQYYISNGVRVHVTATYSSHHANRIRLKCPVRVHYGRNQPISV